MEKDHEQKFYEFLDEVGFEAVGGALLNLVRVSFTAGWLAAGGKFPDTKEKQADQGTGTPAGENIPKS